MLDPFMNGTVPLAACYDGDVVSFLLLGPHPQHVLQGELVRFFKVPVGKVPGVLPLQPGKLDDLPLLGGLGLEALHVDELHVLEHVFLQQGVHQDVPHDATCELRHGQGHVDGDGAVVHVDGAVQDPSYTIKCEIYGIAVWICNCSTGEHAVQNGGAPGFAGGVVAPAQVDKGGDTECGAALEGDADQAHRGGSGGGSAGTDSHAELNCRRRFVYCHINGCQWIHWGGGPVHSMARCICTRRWHHCCSIWSLARWACSRSTRARSSVVTTSSRATRASSRATRACSRATRACSHVRHLFSGWVWSGSSSVRGCLPRVCSVKRARERVCSYSLWVRTCFRFMLHSPHVTK